MPVLTNEDYQQLGQKVTDDYLMQQIPLNDSIVKLAESMELNPDQIAQIVWSANTTTHLSLMNKMGESNASDRIIEFPVADSGYVLRRLYSPSEDQPLPDSEKIAMDFFSPLMVDEDTNLEKAAEYIEEEIPARGDYLANKKAESILVLRKMAHELEQEMLVEQYEYEEKLASFAAELRKATYLDPEFHSNVEKDAYSLYGDEIVPILTDLRKAANLKDVIDVNKLASKNPFVNTKDKAMETITDLKGHFDKAIKNSKGLKTIKTKAKKYL